MSWAHATRNWADTYVRLQRKFPHLETGAMAFLKQDQARFESYLAATHSLTLTEAKDAFGDFMLTHAAWPAPVTN